MPLDGFAVSCIVNELENTITGGRISRIIQPESDEILLTVKTYDGQYRLLLSANPSLPLACLTQTQKPAPKSAPAFCMYLRKHFGNGKITSVSQPSLERVIRISVEHRDEMGDLCSKDIVMELMGKHSNIIVTDENDVILDSIKKVSANMSSVREVLPGRPYFIPGTDEKKNPLAVSGEEAAECLKASNLPLAKAVYTTFTGFSPVMAEEVCSRASVNSERPACELTETEYLHFSRVFVSMIDEVRTHEYVPAVYYEHGRPLDFSVLSSLIYEKCERTDYDSVSSLIQAYYAEKETVTRIRQKSADLRKIVSTAIERTSKKANLQKKQLKDTEKKDKYRIYGELINTYGYSLEEGSSVLNCVNYYDGNEISIPLDKSLSPRDNAKKYFDRYNKLKRTEAALSVQMEETEKSLSHLLSVKTSLETATDERDLADISNELKEYGYIKKNPGKGKRAGQQKSEPLRFISSDGYEIFVGKNNYQNEEISFKIAGPNDWWFHAKNIPGSHVIVKNGGEEMSDLAFEEAARLAAHFSAAKNAPKAEVDYTLRKNLKKPNGANPGFVIYHTNYSMMAKTDISGIKAVDNKSGL